MLYLGQQEHIALQGLLLHPRTNRETHRDQEKTVCRQCETNSVRRMCGRVAAATQQKTIAFDRIWVYDPKVDWSCWVSSKLLAIQVSGDTSLACTKATLFQAPRLGGKQTHGREHGQCMATRNYHPAVTKNKNPTCDMSACTLPDAELCRYCASC